MYSDYLQNKQQNNAGDAQSAGDDGVEPGEGDADIHPCSEEVEDEKEHKAEAGMDEELEAPFHALFENFEKKSDEKNAHDKGEDYYCDCHFILSPSNALKFRHAALRRALRALISWMQASRMSGSELWLKQM